MNHNEPTPLSTIPWSGLVLRAGAFGTEGQQAFVESNRRVAAALQDFDRKAGRQATAMIWLTVAIAVLTFALIVIEVVH
jgi:hypothetical protein